MTAGNIGGSFVVVVVDEAERLAEAVELLIEHRPIESTRSAFTPQDATGDVSSGGPMRFVPAHHKAL